MEAEAKKAPLHDGDPGRGRAPAGGVEGVLSVRGADEDEEEDRGRLVMVSNLV